MHETLKNLTTTAVVRCNDARHVSISSACVLKLGTLDYSSKIVVSLCFHQRYTPWTVLVTWVPFAQKCIQQTRLCTSLAQNGWKRKNWKIQICQICQLKKLKSEILFRTRREQEPPHFHFTTKGVVRSNTDFLFLLACSSPHSSSRVHLERST